MKNKALASSMFNENVRVDKVINLASMTWTAESFSSVVKDAFDSDFLDILEALGVDDSEISIDATLEEIAQFLVDSNKGGWLVLFATPIPVQTEGVNYTISWGLYTTKWMYGEDFDALCDKSLHWKREFVKGYCERWREPKL